MRQSFRQSIRRFRGESVEAGAQSQANLRGRQPRSKLNPDQLNFNNSPPDYATVIIETERHSSDYGSIAASTSQELTSSIVSSELPLVENLLSRNAEIVASAANDNQVKRDSIHSQSFRYSKVCQNQQIFAHQLKCAI